MNHLTSTYHIPLVILSVIIAILASYTVLHLSVRLIKAKPPARYIWLTAGAFAMGLGIWAMHFIAMLAFQMAMPVSYDFGMVFVSIIPAIVSAALAFYMISRPDMGNRQIYLGSLFIATGIVSMHYTGMKAMIMAADIVYDPILWTLSAIIAFVASVAALYLLKYVSQNAEKPGINWFKLVSSIVMGFAISGMHYTGMAAAKFMPHEGHQHIMTQNIDSTYLAYGIALGVLLLFGILFISMFVDRKFEYQAISSELKFRSVIESANDAIILANRDAEIISWNLGAERMFGYKKDEAIGEKLQLIIPDPCRNNINSFLFENISDLAGSTTELTGLRKNGEELPIELSLAAWGENGQVFFSGIIRDITERKKTESKINRLVYRDPLTGLPNRLLLNDRLKLAISQAEESKKNIGILFIDLDRFKNINDSLGHATGDLLLVEVGKRIKAAIGESDTLSRQGGDEFIILLPQTDANELTKKAQKIIDLFSQSIMIREYELFVTPSIGVAMYPVDGKDIETLIKNADTAMYRVKEQGKNSFQFYAPSMNATVSRKMLLEIGMRKALERDEFKVFYQPQVDVKDGKLIGVEALMRWMHPEWGSISPAEFIPIAEETGLILTLGEWVLEQACVQNKAWQNNGYQPFKVGVNISSRQFQHSNLVEMVKNVLAKTGLAPEYLELELTESIIQSSEDAVVKMQQLRDMGIHLSIDDFGTGYSSLSYLKTFPINTLKIDQTFTRNIYTDPKDASLVDTIINMAHNLDLKVIAEGVETEEQLRFLEEKQCNEAQGYFFSRPIPAEELEIVLAVGV
ncbi:EAL domain-containing protein [Metabacillus sp. GX 13764]|uniref:bifunctional diguanylate cyclase/phosphodiesterase n=1 Tax=Metabacillus kandeliae TaxID=2900151 RepID=UPI001E42464E|nr:bifunctional diguanylate cyclase/phosphodiesterase [Metabacillus kandeliae]MCD7034540.1 EAL domain-containing protein [Metabacillus kandeliae]